MKKLPVIIFCLVSLLTAGAVSYYPEIKKMFVSENPDIPKFITESMAAYRSENLDKVKQLSGLGFSQYSLKLQALENIKKYDSIYAGYTFITDEVFDNLLKTFKLAYAWIDQYTGDVPNENAINIKNFVTKYPLGDKKMSIGLHNLTVDGTLVIDPEKEQLLIICPTGFLVRTEGGYTPDGEEIIKDPIVLHKVDGGYIIVTSW